jgi:hypothetical protein
VLLLHVQPRGHDLHPEEHSLQGEPDEDHVTDLNVRTKVLRWGYDFSKFCCSFFQSFVGFGLVLYILIN